MEISHDHVLPKCSSLNDNCMLSYIKPLEKLVFSMFESEDGFRFLCLCFVIGWDRLGDQAHPGG